MGGIGFQEILLVAIVVVVFFGAKKLPEFMRGLGKGIREFKDATNEVKKEITSTKDEIPKIDKV